MDADNKRANLRRICSLLGCIAVASLLLCSNISQADSAEGNPGTSGENGRERLSGRGGLRNVGHSPSESCSASPSQGVNRPLMILSTVDGKVLALDIQNAGQQQWSMDAGIGPLLSSSIGQLEIMGPEGVYKVIPSLNGGLFKWDGETLEAVPFTAESLLSTSFRLNEETMMVGGKEINTFGINARTGELHYICGIGGCQLYGDEAGDDQDIIVIQHTRQTVRAVDQRNGLEKWNFSVGQHDVTFLKGQEPSNNSVDEDEEVECEVDSEYDPNDDIPLVKVDMATKTVFALGGPSGRQLLWSHELESCIANAWTIHDGVVSEVDLFQPVTLGLSAGTEPQMTPFFSDYSQPMVFVGHHKNQMYVQPSSNINSEISQAAWAANRGQANPQDGSLVAPRVRWRPYAYTSVSRTPLIVAAKNEENLVTGSKEKGESNRDVTVWNQYPFDNGYYLLHQLTPVHMMPQNRQLEGNESQDGGLEILFSVSVWTWWREIFGTSMLLAIGMQLFFNYVLKPRRKRRAAERERKDEEEEETEMEQKKPSSLELNIASEQLAQEFKSRYLTDFEHTECLGKGGFGIVFRAKNKVDENSYAVKRITLPNREEARDKVLREARTLAILDHSGIVRYFNSWLEEPPLGWQDIQDKKFVGESLAGNEGLTSLDTPALFNKNSELVRNHDQLMQQTGGKSGIDPSFSSFGKTRESPILKFDLSGESSVCSEERVNQKGDNKVEGVESEILFPGGVDGLSGGFEVGSEFEESGSFSIVFQGNSQNMSADSDSGEETPQNLGILDDSTSNRSTDTSINNTMDVPFKHYANDAKGVKDLDKSESFQIFFEDSGCTDQPQYSDTESTQSDTSKSSKNSSTPSDVPCIEAHWKEMSTHHARTHSHTPTTSSAFVVKVPKIYLYIQMQLCRKETLKDWLNTNTLSRDRNKVLHIFHQILEAVNYIHGCGMIHRDLKPSNIFFSVDGKVKVGDFGLVTAIDTSMEGAEDSVDGAPGQLHTGKVGTQLYMCPEQVSGQNYDHKVDIFSLGLIFFELFHPFSTHMERIMVMCKAKRQDFPKRFTKELPLEAKFATWLLSHNPDLRPDSDEISESEICGQLYEDYVPPSYHTVRNRGFSNSSR